MTSAPTMEQHMQLWNQAWIRLTDVRRCSAEQLLSFELPTSGFLCGVHEAGSVRFNGVRYETPGDWLLHGGKGTRVQIEPQTRDCSFYLLLYNAEMPVSTDPYLHHLERSVRPFEQVSAVRPKGNQLLDKQFVSMTQLWSADSASSQLHAKAYFVAFIYEWLQLVHQSENHSGNERIAGLIDYMRQHFDQPLTLTQLADYANYSVPHMCELFREVTGLAPIEYLIRLRIDEAKRLLDEGDMSLKQIAEHIGFRDPYYFGRQFKKLSGVSPMRYKQIASARPAAASKTPLLLPPANPRMPLSSDPRRSVSHALGEAHLPRTPRRVVALDWTMAEYLLTLGIVPVGVAGLSGMRRWVCLPIGIPDTMVDIGPRTAPDLALIEALRPDLIVGSRTLTAPRYDRLCAIAPTVAYELFPDPSDTTGYESQERSFMHLAAILGLDALAGVIQTNLEKMYSAIRNRLLSSRIGTNRVVLALGYTEHMQPMLRLSTEGSLAIGVLERIGLVNAYETSQLPSSGYTTVEAANQPVIEGAHMLYIAQKDDNILASRLKQTPQWLALNAHLGASASIWPYGGPMSANMLAVTAAQLVVAGSSRKVV